MMAYERGDDRSRGGRYGDDQRWRDQERGGRYGDDHRGDRSGDDDRGFFERAGEEVRSWFSDDGEDERRRSGHDRERSDWRGGQGSFGGGWGNQQGESWNRERPGVRDPRGSYGNDRGASGRSVSEEDLGRGGYAGMTEGYNQLPRRGETWGGSGFGGGTNHGRRFDRVDPGHVGTHGAHPMSSPVGGTGYGAGFDVSATGYNSSARDAAIIRQSERGDRQERRGKSGGTMGGAMGSSIHDPHYSEWRQRQIEQLDREYEDYCREHQSRFEQDFGGWREKRQTQRQMLGQATAQMEVIGSDGERVGTVDRTIGDHIILATTDGDSERQHRSIPCSWIESVDDKVRLNRSAEEATRSPEEDPDYNRALFENPNQGSDGPHILNRSFSGTYDENR